jgi:hypothetical protein
VGGADLLSGQGAGAVVVLTRTTSHGRLSLSRDGSFTYVPGAGFVGEDAFWVVASRGPLRDDSIEVRIRVLPRRPSPSPVPAAVAPGTSPTAGPMAVGGTSGDGPSDAGVSFGTMGPLDFAFEWVVPGFVLSLPGIILIVAVLAQALIGAVWLPVSRRELGDFGLRRR